jgi:hypothetical protein
MHLTVLRTRGSGAFCERLALVEQRSEQKRTASDVTVMRLYLPDSERSTLKCIPKTKNALDGI